MDHNNIDDEYFLEDMLHHNVVEWLMNNKEGILNLVRLNKARKLYEESNGCEK